MSESKTLLTALLAVQQASPTLPKDATNPHFRSKYTPLDTIVEHIGPILNQHGLVWMTMPCRDEHGDPALKYTLAHAGTGDTLEGTMPLLLTKADPQGMGSAITYARRYSLCAVLNLVADEDDDGNAGSQPKSQEPRRNNNGTIKASEKQGGLISTLGTQNGLLKKQIEIIAAEIVGHPVEVKEGWVAEHLTGGRDGTASMVIDRLSKGPYPEVAETPTPASDVPSDPGLFVHEPAGDTSDVPFEAA